MNYSFAAFFSSNIIYENAFLKLCLFLPLKAFKKHPLLLLKKTKTKNNGYNYTCLSFSAIKPKPKIFWALL